jgi:hypothetical protein
MRMSSGGFAQIFNVYCISEVAETSMPGRRTVVNMSFVFGGGAGCLSPSVDNCLRFPNQRYRYERAGSRARDGEPIELDIVLDHRE